MESDQNQSFKQAQCEILTGVVLPPDIATFWSQSSQQGFKPKAASIGKAILFPSAVNANGNAAQNLSSEVWWSDKHPYQSSLTGESAQQMCDAQQQMVALGQALMANPPRAHITNQRTMEE